MSSVLTCCCTQQGGTDGEAGNMEDSGGQGAGEGSAAQRIKASNAEDAERLVIYCQNNQRPRRTCLTHCARYCTPCRPLLRTFLGWIRSPPPTMHRCAPDHNFCRNPPPNTGSCRPFLDISGHYVERNAPLCHTHAFAKIESEPVGACLRQPVLL